MFRHHIKKGFKKWIELRHDNDILKKCIKVVNQKLHLQIGTYLYKHTFSDTDRLGKKPKKKYLGFHFFDYLQRKMGYG